MGMVSSSSFLTSTCGRSLRREVFEESGGPIGSCATGCVALLAGSRTVEVSPAHDAANAQHDARHDTSAEPCPWLMRTRFSVVPCLPCSRHSRRQHRTLRRGCVFSLFEGWLPHAPQYRGFPPPSATSIRGGGGSTGFHTLLGLFSGSRYGDSCGEG